MTEQGEIFSDQGILFQIPGKKKLVTVSKSFSISAEKEGIRFVFDSAVSHQGKSFSELFFPFSSIESMIINAKQTVEFYSDSVQYRFRTALDRSPLKYQELYLAYRGNSVEDI